MKNILLIDDDIEIAATVTEALIPAGFHVEQSPSIQGAYAKLLEKPFDLAIIDIELQDGSGFDLYQKILSSEQYRKMPVIFLTANDQLGTKISAFTLGADD